MGLSDGTFFMIKHTPLPSGNHPISNPICPMGVADMLEQCVDFPNITASLNLCKVDDPAFGMVHPMTFSLLL